MPKKRDRNDPELLARYERKLLANANGWYSQGQLDEMFDENNRLKPGFYVSGA